MGGIIDSAFGLVEKVADPIFDAGQPIVDTVEKVADKVVPYVPQIGFGVMMGNALGGMSGFGGSPTDLISSELSGGGSSGGWGNSLTSGTGGIADTVGSWGTAASQSSPYLRTLAALASAGAGLYGANKQAQAAKDAAAQAGDAAKYSTYMQKQMYDQSRADWEPWRQVGVTSLAKMASGQPFLPQDPGYQFRFGEGQKAMERSAAARGGLQSGAALKAAQRYGQDYASNEYGNAFNRLASMAGLGQTANAQNQAAGSSYAQNAGNLAMEAAGYSGNAGMVGANARNSAYQGIGNLLGKYWGM